ncbi:MAG: ATP synthase subunit I [Pseudomonadota bacterium]
MKKLQLFVWLVTALLVAGSLFFRSQLVTFSLGAGCLLVITSFYAIYLTTHLFYSSKTSTKILAGLISIFKFAILGLLLWLIITKIPLNLWAFLIGLATIFFAILIYAIYNLCLGQTQNAHL